MKEGTLIYSCMSGIVDIKDSGKIGLGLHISITNGKYQTIYGHCSQILVQEGSHVNAGDVIAKVGSTGNSTGAHLHLEYKVNGVNKNPRTYLKKEIGGKL